MNRVNLLPRQHREMAPLSGCRVQLCLFNALMDNRQIKRMYSGSLCVNVLVFHSLWFLPKSKPYSSFSIVCCHHCQWLMALVWWVPTVMSGHRCSGWGVSVPFLGLMPPHSRQLQLIPWMNVSVAGHEMKIFQQGNNVSIRKADDCTPKKQKTNLFSAFSVYAWISSPSANSTESRWVHP